MDYPYEHFAVGKIVGGGNLKIISTSWYDKAHAKEFIEKCAKLGVSRDSLTVARQIRFSYHDSSEWERVS